MCIMTGSPPSRAAWIEIINSFITAFVSASPPSRAAWIEISTTQDLSEENHVAAFTGGVD